MRRPSKKSPILSRKKASDKLVPLFVRRFAKRVQNFAHEHALWQKNDYGLIAVSGGPDSLCLLDLLAYLAPKYAWRLEVIHVNYGLRGNNSERDQRLVEKRARFYGLPCHILHPTVKTRGNLEEKLRELRYTFFEKVRVQRRAQWVALAHHADDQAETFLLRLLRGSGLRGLSSMQAKRDFYIRPLLETRRKEIITYLEARSLSSHEDASNRDPRFLRNRIRHELLPYLEKRFQPNIQAILQKTASHLAYDYATLEQKGERLQVIPEKAGVSFSCMQALALPESLLRRELRSMLAPHFAGKMPPQNILREIRKLLQSTKKKNQKISFRGLILERNGDKVRLLKISSSPQKP